MNDQAVLINDLPVLLFATPAKFEAWLAVHHASAPGAWLQLAKKGTGLVSISYAQALESALCYGWIDSLKRTYDAASWIQKFTPRGPKSIWSQVNKDKIATLIEHGRMQPAGLAAVAQAQAGGRWDAAYASQSNASVPVDLQAALDANPAASAFFATLNSVNRYAILFRIHNVKKAETRSRKIAEFVAMLERGEMVYS